MKNIIKKYRALGIVAAGMIFNLISSILFAKNGAPFNLQPLSIGEWICDIISSMIILFGAMTMAYDIWNYKPKQITTYKRVNGEIIEIIKEE